MDSHSVGSLYSALLAKKLIAEFAKRGMEGFYCETREDALKAALQMAEEGGLMSCGGSATLHEIGLIRALTEGKYNFLNPAAPKSGREKEEAARRALHADVFFMGANAIAETGELVNADGIGNRAAALLFGPRRVVIVAGINKVEPTLDAAILRVKTRAARMGFLAFKSDFEDFDSLAKAAEGAASHLIVTGFSVMKGRIKVILVGEALGY